MIFFILLNRLILQFLPPVMFSLQGFFFLIFLLFQLLIHFFSQLPFVVAGIDVCMLLHPTLSRGMSPE